MQKYNLLEKTTVDFDRMSLFGEWHLAAPFLIVPLDNL